ncbi:MAG: hypothetical protein PHS61_05570 [Candidatus Omnitrophica bacterium]|nr:hypothetical protein [Candidatus Omnitrophota bacterium]
MNRHTILIAAHDAESLKKEIIRWGEAPWWPKKSLMRFERLTSGAVSPGTRYRQKVELPFGPGWNVEVGEISDRGIKRRFLDGMFRGYETVCFVPCPEGMRVDYEMCCEVCGAANRLLWPVIFRRLHDRNIEAILKGLKIFMEKP